MFAESGVAAVMLAGGAYIAFFAMCAGMNLFPGPGARGQS